MKRTDKVETVPGIITPRVPADAFLTAPLDPAKDEERLLALHDLHVLDTDPEPAFDDLVRLASRIADVPTALVGLVDTERQWFKARVGLDVCTTGRDVAFCDHVVREQAELEVPDTRLDLRFKGNALVTGPPHIVFYAGFPLFLENGLIPGTLCVIGYEAKQLTEDQKISLRALAELVSTQLKLRRQNEYQATEIALRMAAEAELAASRKEFQDLAEHSLDIIARYRYDGTITYCSPSVENVLGFPQAEVIGRSANGFIPPEQQPEFIAAQDGAKQGRTTTLTIQAQTAWGAYRWLELTVAPVPGREGVEPEILSAARDVDARMEVSGELARSEARYRGVYQDSPIGIMLADGTGLILEANPALCRMYGRDEADVVGKARDAFVPEGDPLPPQAAEYRRSAVPGSTFEMERRFVRGDGETRWAQISVAAVAGPEGELWSLAHLQDITDRKAAERALADSEANLAAIAQVVRRMRTGEDPRGAIVAAVSEIGGADSASIIEVVDPGDEWLTVSASSRDEYVGTRMEFSARAVTISAWNRGEAMFVPDARESLLVNPAMLAQTDARSILWQPITQQGKVRALLVAQWRDVVDLSARAVQAVVLLAEEAAVALQHHELLREYADLATTDTLTGLPNRRSWDEQVERLMQLTRRTGEALVLAIADVDHFKVYNDTKGHLEGDVLLREVARCAQAQLREADVVARWGGEEFAVALPGCNAADAMAVLNRIRTTIPRGQTVSFGLAEYYPGATAESLMNLADNALYDAKRNGRNRIVAAHHPDDR